MNNWILKAKHFRGWIGQLQSSTVYQQQSSSHQQQSSSLTMQQQLGHQNAGYHANNAAGGNHLRLNSWDLWSRIDKAKFLNYGLVLLLDLYQDLAEVVTTLREPVPDTGKTSTTAEVSFILFMKKSKQSKQCYLKNHMCCTAFGGNAGYGQSDYGNTGYGIRDPE